MNKMYDGEGIVYLEEVCPHVNENYGCIANECKNTEKEQFICPCIGGSVEHISKHIKQMKIKIRRCNELEKTIPQKDMDTLENIDCWVIRYDFVLCPSSLNFPKEKWIYEARKLIDAGFTLGFSCSRGVGRIVGTEGNYDISLWIHHINSIIRIGDLDECLEWIWNFIGKKDD